MNNRGVLIQTLIALLDALLGKSPCQWLELEPQDAPDIVDLYYGDAEAVHAAQVKSSDNPFTLGFAGQLATELKEKVRKKLGDNVRCRLVPVL